MSYLVLARKYRPQLFEDLVGQEHVARTLKNAIERNRVHHAYLFTGARGVGKISAARILAKALCCVNGPTATPCGECDFCREIVSGHSVDVVEIDGASNRGVDDARTLREAVRYAPSRGRKKVTIIDEVHMFTTEAFNALLKTLEEPPAHAVFILATTEVHKIPITILSRCQRYDFKLIPTGRLSEHLSGILEKEGIAFEPEGLRLVARQAAGSVRDALSLLDQVIAYVGDAILSHDKVVEVLGVADRRLLASLFQAVLAREPATALRLMADAIDRGIDLVQLSRAFLGFIHDVELAGLVPASPPGAAAGSAPGLDLLDVTADELAELRTLATAAPKGLCTSLFDRWMRAVEEAGKSQTARLLLEMALVELCQTEPLLPLGDLLTRLGELEERLGRGSPPRGGGADPGGGPRPAGQRGGARALASTEAPPARDAVAPPTSAPAAPAADPASGAAPPPVAPAASFANPSFANANPAQANPAQTGAGATPVSPRPQPPRGDAPSAAPAPPVVTASASAIAASFEPARPSRNGTAEEKWGRLRVRMQDRPALAAALDHAAVDAWEDSRVVLSFADRLLLDQTEKGRKLIEGALQEICGGPTTLQLKMGGGARPMLQAESVVQAASQATDRKRLMEEAKAHPMIRKAEEVFGISAREIKVQ